MRTLAWDSDFFGVPIGSADLAREELGAALDEARAAGVACVYLHVPGDALDVVREAVLRGARPLELRSELDLDLRRAAGIAPQAGVRRAGDADLEHLLALAEPFSASSRFRADPRFDPARVAEMYRLWIRRCLREGAVVVPDDRAPAFGAVRVEGDVVWYDLLYVDAAVRRRGLGRALLLGALAAVEAPAARTVMQLSNLPVQRLFQSVGFRLARTSVVLHLWLDEAR